MPKAKSKSKVDKVITKKKALTTREQLKSINDCAHKCINTKDKKKKNQLKKSISTMMDSVEERTNRDIVLNTRTGKFELGAKKKKVNKNGKKK